MKKAKINMGRCKRGVVQAEETRAKKNIFKCSIELFSAIIPNYIIKGYERKINSHSFVDNY